MWKRRAPWERRKWRKGHLRPLHNGALLLLVGPLFCGGMFWVFSLEPVGGGGETISLIGRWLFAVIGAGLGAFGAIRAARYLRFCGARLVMLDMPGVIGGSFSARLDLPKPMPRGTTVTVRLVNEQTRAERSSGEKNSHETRTTVYEAVTQHDMDEVSFRGGKYSLTVAHEIPEYAKDPRIIETAVDSINTNITVTYDWYLTAKASLPGADLDLRFQVPVYLTDGSIPNGLFSRVTRHGRAEHRLDADGNLTCDIVQPHSQSDGATENGKSEQIAAPLPSEDAPSEGR